MFILRLPDGSDPIILGLYFKMKYLGDADFAYVYIYWVPLFVQKVAWLC